MSESEIPVVMYRNAEGEVLPASLRRDKKSGLFYREDTSDRAMIRDCFKNYQALVSRLDDMDVLLDLGANVGAFSVIASPLVYNVFAVEADRHNFDMVAINCRNSTNVIFMHGAVVPSDFVGDTVTFETMDSKQNACSGRVNTGKIRAGRTANSVPALPFANLVEKTNSTVLKIDIEGGEYGILDREIPEQIRIIGGELHGMSKATKEAMDKTHQKLKDDGWKFLLEEHEIVFGKPCLLNFVCER